MSFGEVRELLQWNPDGGHPVDDLNMLLHVRMISAQL